MAKDNELIKTLKEESMIPEAYLVGLFWSDPELYGIYNAEKLNSKTFLNKIWGFYFGLGRYMYENQVSIFDDITIYKYVQDTKQEEKFEKYGEYETVNEVIKEVHDKKENIDAYYEEVKKNRMLLNLQQLLGDQVLEKEGKYDYRRLSREKLFTYWSDKMNRIGMDGDTSFQEAYLLEGLDELVDRLDVEPDVGLEFYNAKRMTEICNGQAKGCLYINGGFGGKGKTSMSFEKVIMSHLRHKEKLVVIANEQALEDFQKMLLVTAMGILKIGFQRKRINEGGFNADEKKKLKDAIQLVKSWTQGEERLIVFVFLETYTMDFVKKVLTYYHHRGYRSVMIDTGKPSDELGGMARWERFTEDFKELYKMIKPQNLNMFCWVNVQLADGALNQRFLNEYAFGDSKKIKNEASVVFLGRHIWEDEFAGGKNELTVWNYVPKDADETENDPAFSEDNDTKKHEHKDNGVEENVRYKDGDPKSPYKQKLFNLKQTDKNGNQNLFYLVFTSKNRRGQDNTTGLPVLVIKPNFNNNTWKEIGWTTVRKDYSY